MEECQLVVPVVLVVPFGQLDERVRWVPLHVLQGGGEDLLKGDRIRRCGSSQVGGGKRIPDAAVAGAARGTGPRLAGGAHKTVGRLGIELQIFGRRCQVVALLQRYPLVFSVVVVVVRVVAVASRPLLSLQRLLFLTDRNGLLQPFRLPMQSGVAVMGGGGRFWLVVGHVHGPLFRPALPSHVAGVLGKARKALVQRGEVAVRVEDAPPVVRVEHHGERRVHGQQWVADQKGVEQPFDDVRVPDVVCEPGEDPRQAEEGLHVGVVQVRVDDGIEGVQEREEDDLESRLELEEVALEGVPEMGQGDLAQHLRGEVEPCRPGCRQRRGGSVRAHVTRRRQGRRRRHHVDPVAAVVVLGGGLLLCRGHPAPDGNALVRTDAGPAGTGTAQGVQEDARHVVVALVVPEPLVRSGDPPVRADQRQVDEVRQLPLLPFQQRCHLPVPLLVPVLVSPRPLAPRQQVPRAPGDVPFDLVRVHRFDEQRGTGQPRRRAMWGGRERQEQNNGGWWHWTHRDGKGKAGKSVSVPNTGPAGFTHQTIHPCAADHVDLSAKLLPDSRFVRLQFGRVDFKPWGGVFGKGRRRSLLHRVVTVAVGVAVLGEDGGKRMGPQVRSLTLRW